MNPYETTTQYSTKTILPNKPLWSYRRSAWQGFLATVALPLIYSIFSTIYRMSSLDSPLVELKIGVLQILLVTLLFGTVGALIGLMTSFLGRIFIPADRQFISDETPS
jgi:hypothetical protein